MRDIITDLEERIRAEERGCRELEQSLISKRDHIQLLKRLLNHETAPKPAISIAGNDATILSLIPLSDFIIEQAAAREKTKDQLKDAADLMGYFENEKKSAGRIIHAIVVSLLKSGKLEQVPDGRTGKKAKFKTSQATVRAHAKQQILEIKERNIAISG